MDDPLFKSDIQKKKEKKNKPENFKRNIILKPISIRKHYWSVRKYLKSQLPASIKRAEGGTEKNKKNDSKKERKTVAS